MALDLGTCCSSVCAAQLAAACCAVSHVALLLEAWCAHARPAGRGARLQGLAHSDAGLPAPGRAQAGCLPLDWVALLALGGLDQVNPATLALLPMLRLLHLVSATVQRSCQRRRAISGLSL